MIKHNRGSITLLAVYICSLLLFISLLFKSVFLENYLYYKEYNHKYNLFVIENALIMNVYQNPNKVNYSGDKLVYKSKLSIDKGDYLYKVKLSIYMDTYNYEIRYDKDCHKITSFVKEKVINNI